MPLTSVGGHIFTIISTGSGNGEGVGKLLFNKSSPLGTTMGNIMTFDYATSNVGVGCTSPAAKLHVIGNIIASSTITASGVGCTSDIRYKKNIHDIQNALEIVDKIDGKTYYWRADEFKDMQFNQIMQYGFIAQEIEKVLPSLVLTDSSSNHYKSVDYSRLSPILVEAIKEQQKTIEDQNLKIKQLEQKQTDTNKELQQLKTENTGLRGDIEGIKKHLGLNAEAKR